MKDRIKKRDVNTAVDLAYKVAQLAYEKVKEEERHYGPAPLLASDRIDEFVYSEDKTEDGSILYLTRSILGNALVEVSWVETDGEIKPLRAAILIDDYFMGRDVNHKSVEEHYLSNFIHTYNHSFYTDVTSELSRWYFDVICNLRYKLKDEQDPFKGLNIN